MNIEIIKRFYTTDENSSLLIEQWEETMDNFPGINNISFLKDDFILDHGMFINVPIEILEHIIAQKNIFMKDEEAVKLLWFIFTYVCSTDDYSNRNKSIPVLKETMPELYPLFFFLVLLATIPRARKIYNEQGLPENILKDSLYDFNIWMEHNKKEFGIIGLTYHDFGWLIKLLNGKTFRLGRLQFQKFDFDESITVFRHKSTNDIMILCGDGVRYNKQGLIDGIGGVWDENNHWFSSFKQKDDMIIGNPISKAGFAENCIVKLDPTEWIALLHNGDKTINIHIPAGAPLTPDLCRESLELAKVFWSKHFPDYKYKVFVCFSWFLDPQLDEILGKDSNIVKFHHLGRIYPIGNESGVIRRVFGENAKIDGINSVPHKTNMQRNIAKFINNGGVLRNGGLVILY